MEEMWGACFAASLPPFLGLERAAVDVDVCPERRSPRYHARANMARIDTLGGLKNPPAAGSHNLSFPKAMREIMREREKRGEAAIRRHKVVPVNVLHFCGVRLLATLMAGECARQCTLCDPTILALFVNS